MLNQISKSKNQNLKLIFNFILSGSTKFTVEGLPKDNFHLNNEN